MKMSGLKKLLYQAVTIITLMAFVLNSTAITAIAGGNLPEGGTIVIGNGTITYNGMVLNINQ